MLNKRGIGGEIDWLLATGLFILSIVFVFVLFRPGLTPIYDSRSLLTIAQAGFNNDTNWEITKLPIFFIPTNNTYVGNKLVNLTTMSINLLDGTSNPNGEQRLKNLIQGKNKLNIEVYYLNRSATDNPGFSIPQRANEDDVDDDVELPGDTEETPADVREARRDYESRHGAMRSGSIRYNITSDGVLIVPAKLEQQTKTKSLITVSDRAINFDLNNLSGSSTLKGCSAIGKIEVSLYPYSTVSSRCPVIYEFGAIETVSGISLSSFLVLNETTIPGSDCITGYDCVKQKWKFPITKEFQIEIKSIPLGIGEGDPPFTETFPKEASIPLDTNVFVRQFNYFVLTDDGTKIPVIVKISIW